MTMFFKPNSITPFFNKTPTLITSFTFYVPHHHHKLIPLHGNTGGTTNKHYKTIWTAFILVQHSHNTPNQRKQPPKHISGGLCDSVCEWVDGRGGGGSFYSYIPTTSDFFFFLIHSILPADLFCFSLQLMVQTLTQKEKIIGRVEKTKLITGGISTSQCCLKCNYMGLEPWLRLGWLQISHWQTYSWCKI